MSRIQKDVRIHQLQGETIFNAYLAKKNSCAIVISYSGETTNLLKAMKLLQAQAVPIILMTSIGDNASIPMAQQVLRLATREKLYSKIGTFSTDTSITYLLECLYSGVFAKNYQENLNLRKQASKMIEFERTSSSQILREE
ncbi:phosphosugar-binding transcriptionalregulator [Streptococcus dysgalactiae subsp. equisimilis]|uniref:Phosphosugar-binding transcriptionalregulator n=2 Tax=Streptococcus dysgalactiae TaxID=1334 RepID=A0A9X8XH55_STREQ|nr:putative truncated phosphosugar-binding transcriptionalregulator [Streptococcus dysgalactiae subsp. equisimilis GGS_124]SUN62345.1 phosphosugar-binding transcriptionalregulator [Streptococcus dysgalactiae subsp. equisimilis]VTS34930.1 phosphosugar-binding transcriptionalregulator [Streptococcus dysgalactiae subsp. equisimilis]VTT06514.1 phosphosugar-binding transcriptionalregulator [Streptococcus dysgalactiae subsp. equisimilis]